MGRWSSRIPYWVAYYLIYIGALAFQTITDFPGSSREEWVDALALSAGIAFTVTVVIELGVSAMLLIPRVLESIRESGRVEERRTLLETLVREKIITDQQRREYEEGRKGK